MTPPPDPTRLSSITTLWTVLRQANDGTTLEASSARAQMWERYSPAIRRYLQAIVGDPHAAEEITQEFAVLLVAGNFKLADPRLGRFRNYVKTVLRRLVGAHRNRERKQPAPVPPDDGMLADLATSDEQADRILVEKWRDEILSRALQTLGATHPEFHAVLRFRADHPRMPSREMAEHLTRTLRRTLNAVGVRQMLCRARVRLCELLREEIAQSLEEPTPELINAELGELGLLVYCQSDAE